MSVEVDFDFVVVLENENSLVDCIVEVKLEVGRFWLLIEKFLENVGIVDGIIFICINGL